MRGKQRHREVKSLVQGHRVSKWWSQDGDPGRLELFTTSCYSLRKLLISLGLVSSPSRGKVIVLTSQELLGGLNEPLQEKDLEEGLT